ncbi:MAG: LysR family transcriptional regulator [Sphingobium sp.]
MRGLRYIDVRHIYYFVQVVEAGSISRAADILNATQPGVTNRIKTIEQHLDVKLLNRGLSGVSPTPEGLLFYKRAKRIIKELEAAAEEILTQQDRPEGRICFAASHSTSFILGAPLGEAVMADLPGAQFSLAVGTSAEVFDKIIREEADLALLFQDGFSSRVHSEPLVEEELFLIVSADAPDWKDRSTIRASEIGQMKLVMGSTDRRSFGTRQICNIFAEAAVDLHIVGEMNSMSSLLDFVGATQSGTILPWAAAARQEEAGLVRRLRVEDIPLRRTLALTWLTSRPMTPLMNAVARLARAKAAELITGGHWKYSRLVH